MKTTHDQIEHDLNTAVDIIDSAWRQLGASPYVQSRTNTRPEQLPSLSFAEAERRSASGHRLLRSLEHLDMSRLPHDLVLTLRLVRFRARIWAREADWYWTAIDPLGIGNFGLFLPTAYCGGSLLNWVHQQLESFEFVESGDTDRYLGLISDYARLLEELAARTLGQAERGIRIPTVQVDQARALLSSFKSRAERGLTIAPSRLGRIKSDRFLREIERRVSNEVGPAFDRALAALSSDYLSKASKNVGIGQFSAGAEVYSELVKLHTTMNLTPDEVHQRGITRMCQITESMEEIEDELGFRGRRKELMAQLNTDPKWRAKTADEVSVVFHRYIDRLKPSLDRYFAHIPSATYGVARLPEALEGSMTFGYYDAPREDRAQGLYMYNAKNMTQQSLFNVAALVYHELVPGHHLHLAGQQENTMLCQFRRHSFVNAYNEGWAEYAATFAGEIGMYQLPEEQYGRLVMDAFLTCRLVVDTGMNVLGWSLEKARRYMSERCGMSDGEIATETIRYSCDIPGQALAYKLGESEIMSMRTSMRRDLGSDFDLRTFHSAILDSGALPIPDLQWHFDHQVKLLLRR